MTGPGRHDLEEIRGRLKLSELVGRDVAWDRRKTNAAQGDYWAACPFHQEKSASFHVRDREGYFYCFGCHAKGDLFGYVQERDGIDFAAAVRLLAGELGLGPAAPEDRSTRDARAAAMAEERDAAEAEARASADRRLAMAGEIWRQAIPDAELLGAYLGARGVRIDALRACYGGFLPPSLRMHRALSHYAGGRRIHTGPAMIGMISRDRRFLGVHRTWISRAGRKEMAGRKLDKQWLGLTGAMMGAPVRFTAPGRRMIVGEGIETVLAVYSWLAARGEAGPDAADPWSAEAALSLGALAGAEDPVGRGPASPTTGRQLPSAVPDWDRPSWACPDGVEELVILAEGSRSDPERARRHALRAVRRHVRRADGGARICRIARPGDWAEGLDYADLAAAEAVTA